MKNVVILVLAISLYIVYSQSCYSKTVKRVYTVPNSSYSSPYCDDLDMIEEYLFGKTYYKEAPGLRLNRIEESLFNKTYPSLNIAQRMNRALENYRDDYYNRNYLTQFANTAGIGTRIRNRFIGQPTGFSPSVINTPFSSGNFMPGINYAGSHNRSYRYGNFVPANMGAGVTILD